MKISDILNFFEKDRVLYTNILSNYNLEALILNTKLVDIYKTSKIGFIALKGQNDPLDKYLQEIFKIKPYLIIADQNCNYKNVPNDVNILVIKDLDSIIDELLKFFYGIKDNDLNVFGVTGTNGKTTITTVLHSLFCRLSENNNFSASLIGTINYKIDQDIIMESSISNVPLTTPDICTNYFLLNLSKQRKVKNVFMEISSHSLDQQRIKGINFKITAFTNLSQDHLDYHKTMKDYFLAKRKLFTDYNSDFIIINTSNKYGRILYEELSTKFENLITFKVKEIKTNNSLNAFYIYFNDPIKREVVREKIETDMIGKYNYENLSIVYITFYLFINYVLLEDPRYLDKAKALLANSSQFMQNTGRLEMVNRYPLIFVDYAHTPEALKNTLKILVKLKSKISNESRIITVFGAGGNRDKTKRPIMGKVASSFSDVVILTSDNPRNEEPLSIIEDIKKGIKPEFKSVYIEVNRKEAIKKAIKIANKNDIILIAGKGHEKYQIIGNQILEFYDKEVIIQSLKDLSLLKGRKI